MEGVEGVFSGGGEVGTEPGEALGTEEGAEAAGDFLLEFDHADVLFSLVVGKGDTDVVKESEDGGLVPVEPVEDVLGFGLFSAATSDRRQLEFLSGDN